LASQKERSEISCTSIEELDVPPILDGMTQLGQQQLRKTAVLVSSSSLCFYPVFRNEEMGDLNDPAEVQRRERLRKKQELQMQFQLKRKGRPKNESWNQCVVRPDPVFLPQCRSGFGLREPNQCGPGYCSDFAWKPKFWSLS
jgi:hypothetical protein